MQKPWDPLISNSIFPCLLFFILHAILIYFKLLSDQYIAEHPSIKEQVGPYVKKYKSKKQKSKKTYEESDSSSVGFADDDDEDSNNFSDSSNSRSVKMRLGRNNGRVAKPYRRDDDNMLTFKKGAFEYNIAPADNYCDVK